jgi:hypothetical protein
VIVMTTTGVGRLVRRPSGFFAAPPRTSAPLAVDTSFGHALALELDDELILLLLQRDWDTLLAYAARLHRCLIDLRWRAPSACSPKELTHDTYPTR